MVVTGVGADDHLRALAGRREGRRLRLFGFFVQLAPDRAHRQLDRVNAFFGREAGHAVVGWQLDVHRQAVGPTASLLDQERIGVGNGLEVDVAAELVHLAQLARDRHQLLHRVVGRLDDARAEEQAVDVVAQVKILGQLDHLVDREARPRHVRGAPVDAVLAVVDAEIGEQDLEQRDAAAVRRIAVADAHAGGGAQAVLAFRAALGRTAAGAGCVVLGRVGQDFELVVEFHRARVTVWAYSITRRAYAYGALAQPCARAAGSNAVHQPAIRRSAWDNCCGSIRPASFAR